MSADSDDVQSEAGETAVAETDEFRMHLEVSISDSGPCRKHVSVRVPQSDIDHFRGLALEELTDKADVPGFRKGHVPPKLIERRFKDEISADIKQKVLVYSLEQLAEEHDLDPINEPDLAVEDLEIPTEGDFEYEFDVEVRPDFALPDYSGLKIKRLARDVSESDVDDAIAVFLRQYGERRLKEAAVAADDIVVANVCATHGEKSLTEIRNLSILVKPILRFQDAELEGFDKLLIGAQANDVREADLVVSRESSNVEMRSETVHLAFEVQEVRHFELPAMNRAFFDRIGVESVEELRAQVRDSLERQIAYQQRQSTRAQVLEKITESATWDLPETLVMRQTENAMRREILEMQQSGFSKVDIAARENEMRQHAVSTTRQALKEHFVLDKIATSEDIKVAPADIEFETTVMAAQSGESPRRMRAKLKKSGMLDNLEAQIRERKAVDFILKRATFEDVPMGPLAERNVESVPHAVCGAGAVIDAAAQEQEKSAAAETDDDAAS